MQLKALLFISFVFSQGQSSSSSYHELRPLRDTCPPPQIADAMKLPLNLSSFLGEWFVQYQIPTKYLPETSNFCVKARYVLRPDRKSIDVFNYANKMMVNGKKQGIMLRGKLNQGGQRKLSIGPTFIPSFFFGPYWIVATGPIVKYQYTWAIISGGSPNKCVNDACLADGWSFTGNGQGFWLFTRDQIANPDMILAMMSHAQKLGLDISSLKPVIQERCLYL